MPVQKLKSYLDANGVKYVTISHSPAFTAQEVAASAHVPGREMAKTVMIKVDGKMAMAVLPATFKVDLEMLRQALGAQNVELATEEEFKDLFPDCELGAMPPFGNLYGMDVFMAATLAEDEEIVFNAGTHTELIRMAFPDYVRLVKPVELQFSLVTA
ncbi:YbaK/EbsC family protein [Rhodocaloribacter litoris]|uniref:aminoacyl-tRNA deacylase n=1 Tax=Rhodocaloribacter litoris TaxID=2558931 RepID=UPI00141DCA2D|nr:YbaK/EbsC family protein [Rhodocaloribacter litoris]QXD14506.1 YbaK/EbsC family protein [Rhodocaloribacter litoris]